LAINKQNKDNADGTDQYGFIPVPIRQISVIRVPLNEYYEKDINFMYRQFLSQPDGRGLPEII